MVVIPRLPRDFQAIAMTMLEVLSLQGVENITSLNIIAAPEGINKVKSLYPNINIYITAIDEKLNDNGYIVPGLGDAGDRFFNTIY